MIFDYTILHVCVHIFQGLHMNGEHNMQPWLQIWRHFPAFQTGWVSGDEINLVCFLTRVSPQHSVPLLSMEELCPRSRRFLYMRVILQHVSSVLGYSKLRFSVEFSYSPTVVV